MDNQPKQIRLSISETARLFGVDTFTIRRAIKRQELNYIVVQGRYKINLDSVITWAYNRPTVRKKMNQRGLGQFVEKWKTKFTTINK